MGTEEYLPVRLHVRPHRLSMLRELQMVLHQVVAGEEVIRLGQGASRRPERFKVTPLHSRILCSMQVKIKPQFPHQKKKKKKKKNPNFPPKKKKKKKKKK